MGDPSTPSSSASTQPLSGRVISSLLPSLIAHHAVQFCNRPGFGCLGSLCWTCACSRSSRGSTNCSRRAPNLHSESYYFFDPGSSGLTCIQPTNLKAPFLEQFTDDWDTRWTPSHAKKEDSKSDEDWAYVGEWAVEEPTVLPGIVGDKGLVVKNAAAHHAISAKFPKAVNNKGKTLVVQYEVKLQNGLECGGAYLKLLRDNKALHAEEFSNSSPYVIMFGPDKCGATNKVYFTVTSPRARNTDMNRFTSSSNTRIPRLANTRRSISRLLPKPRSISSPPFTPSL